jgi:threonine dehydratase
VAFVCAHFGVTGRIYMPVTTPEQKILKTKTFGGDAIEIVLTGDFFDETLAAAKAECAETGAHFLSPFDDPDVIEGQASVAVEMIDEMGRAPDRLVLPVGGGGLSAGMISWLDATGAETRLTLVEPAGGASLTAALKIGAPQTIRDHRHLRRWRGGGPDRGPDFRGVCARCPRATCTWRRKTASA